MANSYFQFKQFVVHQDKCAMKVTTDACLFGAWCSEEIKNEKIIIKNCLDIGAGTGLLSLMVAQKNNISIDAVEIDAAAFYEGGRNIKESAWGQQIKIHHSDIKKYEPGFYDCIISNPPFYEREIVSQNEEKNIAHHSSQLKLHELFKTVNQKLSAEGIAFFLLPYKRDSEVEKLLKAEDLFILKKIIVRQTPNHLPLRIMIKCSKSKKSEAEQKEMIIADKKHYTQEFISLLKDYYLYL